MVISCGEPSWPELLPACSSKTNFGGIAGVAGPVLSFRIVGLGLVVVVRVKASCACAVRKEWWASHIRIMSRFGLCRDNCGLLVLSPSSGVTTPSTGSQQGKKRCAVESLRNFALCDRYAVV